MRFLDSSIFLSVLLDTEDADRCEEILKEVETGRLKAVVTTHVLEETLFKLLIAKASEELNTKNLWRIRDELKRNKEVRTVCYQTMRRFLDYISMLCLGGLRIVQVYPEDLFKTADIFRETGLLTADCLHLAVMKRLGLKEIATLDGDFKKVESIKLVL